jgi:hypothetical protein
VRIRGTTSTALWENGYSLKIDVPPQSGVAVALCHRSP